MITVHHLENPRSQRVSGLIEELQVPNEMKRHERNPLTLLALPEFLRVHPPGKSPMIADGNDAGVQQGQEFIDAAFVKPIARGIATNARADFVTPNLERQLDLIEAELSQRYLFAGNFSAADIQMGFPLEAAAQRAVLDARRPKLLAFLNAIHARPAYRRALEGGGPYSFAD